MRLTLRTKLLTIIALVAAAFVAILVTNWLVAAQVRGQLATIEERYVPQVDLGPRLEARFERLRRALQDAVAARDADGLAATVALRDQLIAELDAARPSLAPEDASALRGGIEEYYTVAYDVARRSIAGETGEALVDAMGSMQARHNRTVEILKAATSFDRGTLKSAFAAVARTQGTSLQAPLLVTLGCLVSVLLLSLWLTRGTLRSMAELAAGFERFGRGDFARAITIDTSDELREVARRANEMAESLRRVNVERDRSDWQKSGMAGMTQEVHGDLAPAEVAGRAVAYLARHMGLPAGALYYQDEAGAAFRLVGQYARSGRDLSGAPVMFGAGEGLVGQAAMQDTITVVRDLPPDYLRIRSGLGEGAPGGLVLVPLLHLGRTTGVLELAYFGAWETRASELLLAVRDPLTVAIEVARARAALRAALGETQRQAQRLAAQEHELRNTNDELQAQQHELQQANEDLTRQAEELEVQRQTLEAQNRELNATRLRLEENARALETVSAFKSQFLANMSHELRTPLNSMLLLSGLLADNEAGNLTAKQVEYCRTVHGAGKDLLALINQVLDLAKIEAGKQELRPSTVELLQVAIGCRQVFEPLAHEKGIALEVTVDPGLPESVTTDGHRLDQILRNLLANAIKFTEMGRVSLHIGRPDPDVRLQRTDLQREHTVAFVVTDTGPGIAAEHQERIFAPFEQVDSSSGRRHGGTGLGLTISRELAGLLGGELQLRSVVGAGSTFVCYLPETIGAGGGATAAPDAAPRGATPAVGPAGVEPQAPTTEPYLLLIEDDPVFLEIFGEVIQSQGMTFRAARDGQSGLRMARESTPGGIILDVKLPDTDGWTVMEALRTDPATRDVPVHFVSALDAAARGLAMGAVGYLTKPATREELRRVVQSLAPVRTGPCRVLVVGEASPEGDSLLAQLREEQLEVTRVNTTAQAEQALADTRHDCLIVDLSLPDMDELDLLRALEARHGAARPSVLVYAARALTRVEARRIEAYADAVVLKEGSSRERVIDEVRLFVRRLRGEAPRAQAPLFPSNVRLEGRKILLVDDDMRTVYALSATLRAKGAEVVVADTGVAALQALEEHPDVDAVLMDIMMPEMDGYEAMRRLRRDRRFASLPVIALTAKAMKDDREKCIEAGATDYASKPLNAERLLVLLNRHMAVPDAAAGDE